MNQTRTRYRAQPLTPTNMKAWTQRSILSQNTLETLLPNINTPLDKYPLITITNYRSLLMIVGHCYNVQLPPYKGWSSSLHPKPLSWQTLPWHGGCFTNIHLIHYDLYKRTPGFFFWLIFIFQTVGDTKHRKRCKLIWGMMSCLESNRLQKSSSTCYNTFHCVFTFAMDECVSTPRRILRPGKRRGEVGSWYFRKAGCHCHRDCGIKLAASSGFRWAWVAVAAAAVTKAAGTEAACFPSLHPLFHPLFHPSIHPSIHLATKLPSLSAHSI
jgi:hypothetical protein